MLTVNKYYKMSDSELEIEAPRWKIRAYGDRNGIVDRALIIDQLIKKDQENNSRYAFFISIGALVISIIALFIKK